MATLFLIIILSIFFIIYSIKIVKQSEVYIIERLGRFHKEAHAGITIVLPSIEKVRAVVNLKPLTMIVPPQGALTKDRMTIILSLLVHYQIVEPVKAVYETENLNKSIAYSSITSLREIISKMSFSNVLDSQDYICEELKTALNLTDFKWGCKIEKVEIKELKLPDSITNSFSNELNIEDLKMYSINSLELDESSAIAQEKSSEDYNDVIKKY